LFGQLGVGTSTGPELCNTLSCSTKPVAVLGGLYFRQLSAGQVHTCGKASDDIAYCWGDDGAGSGTAPTRVPDPTE
jgi:Regulator of Chromosome Condensation (RCC1) repeat protein